MEKSEQTPKRTRSTAKRAAATMKEMATDVGNTVKETVVANAGDAFEGVRDTATEQAEAARDGLVNAGERLAEKLHDQADASQGLSSTVLSGVADGIETVTDGLRGRTFGDLMADVMDFARRNPATFALGAAVAGFALARMLPGRSGNQLPESRLGYRDPDYQTGEWPDRAG